LKDLPHGSVPLQTPEGRACCHPEPPAPKAWHSNLKSFSTVLQHEKLTEAI